MSAAGRSNFAETGHVRHPDDFYATPEWCTKAILPHLTLLPTTRILEPSAGSGAIVDVLLSKVDRSQILAIELDASRWQQVSAKCSASCGDFLKSTPADRYDLIITNPPFYIAMDFVKHAFRFVQAGGSVVMLLRLNWLASLKRSDFLRTYCPDVFVLPRRPSFTGKGTDATEYGWFVWRGGEPRSIGAIRILEVEYGGTGDSGDQRELPFGEDI